MFKLIVSWPVNNGSTTQYGSFADMLALGRSFSEAGAVFAWEIIRMTDGVALVTKDAK
jgi:hypothetical protein